MVFNKTIRRRLILHPPQDPEFRNWMMRSRDGGESWSAPEIVPGYDWSGVECAGLTPLGGKRVMLHQWRFFWYPLAAARRRPDRDQLRMPAYLLRGLALSPELDVDRALLDTPETIAPWARGGGEAVAHLSEDGGESWARPTASPPRPSAAAMACGAPWCCPAARSCCPSAISRTTARSSWCAPRMAGAAGRRRCWRRPSPAASSRSPRCCACRAAGCC